MESDEKDRLTKESVNIRHELKIWEKEFAASHDGRKAGREDIKQNPQIAQKYKDYQRLRDIISGKLPVPSKTSKSKSNQASNESSHHITKRKHPAKEHNTPSKRRAVEVLSTPSNDRVHPAQVDPYDSPSVIRNLFTPRKPVVLGPTPQKDGKLLGLLDLLPTDDEESPVKSTLPLVNSTPQKSTAPGHGDLLATPSGAKHSRTPRSSGKRFFLDKISTPLRRFAGNLGSATKKVTTPGSGSTSSHKFATPLFLRRENSNFGKLDAITEADEEDVDSPPAARGPKRPLVRGLSSILANLRQIQHTAMDDEEEAMREMDDMDGPPPKPQQGPLLPLKSPIFSNTAPDPFASKPPSEKVQVEDSQKFEFPFMDFPDIDLSKGAQDDSDDEMDDAEKRMIERDSKLPVYKKKGQKRTTRKHNMKPVARSKPAAAQRKLAAPAIDANENDDIPPDDEFHELQGQASEEPDAIPDTQAAMFTADSLPLYESARNFDSESDNGTQYTASIGGTRYKRAKRPSDYIKENDGRKTKAGAQSHTNYQRLKLRNTGAKGGRPGGRFGKRR